MNIVDYVIIGIIGISVLFGLYRGFIASVLNMGCGLMSFLASFWVSPKLAAAVQSNQSFLNMLLHYTDASSRIGDLETAITNVATLTSQSINSILEKVNLPAPLDTLLRADEAALTQAQAEHAQTETQREQVLSDLGKAEALEAARGKLAEAESAWTEAQAEMKAAQAALDTATASQP